MTSSNPEDEDVQTPEAPARIRPGHAQTRNLSANAGAKRGYVNNAEHPLTLAYSRNQLIRGILRNDDGNEKYTAPERYAAGDEFRRIWEACAASGRDSTDLNHISGGRGDPITMRQAQAISDLARIHAALSATDRQIVQLVCGEGHWPSEAIRKACGDSYKDATIPRLNEALDHLIEALAKVKRSRS